VVTRDHLQKTAGDESNGYMTEDVNCSVTIIAEDDNNIAAVQYNLFNFYHWSTHYPAQ